MNYRIGNDPKLRYKKDAAVLHQGTSQERDSTVFSHRIRSFFYRNVEKILTRKIWDYRNQEILDKKQEKEEDNKG